MSILNNCYRCSHTEIPTNLIVKELVFNYLGSVDVNDFITPIVVEQVNDVIEDANEAIGNINTAIENAESIVDYVSSKVDYSLKTRNDISLERIPSGVNFIQTKTFDGTSGGATYKRVTQSGVSGYPALAWIKSLDGAYWLLDEKYPTPEMFGAKGDLNWKLLEVGELSGSNSNVSGPQRINGTNDYNCFVDALQYLKLKKCNGVVANGNYFIKSFERYTANGESKVFKIPFTRYTDKYTSVLTTDMGNLNNISPDAPTSEKGEAIHKKLRLGRDYDIVGDDIVLYVTPKAGMFVEICQDFIIEGSLVIKGTLWTWYGQLSCGVRGLSNSYYEADLTIGQYDRYNLKIGNHGHTGGILSSHTDYLEPRELDYTEHVHMKSSLVKAASISPATGVEKQDSDPSHYTCGLGNIFDVHFEVDTFGHTNVSSNMLCLFHWGGKYQGDEGFQTRVDGSFDIIKTYHPEQCRLTVSRPIDAYKTPMGRVFEYASTINCKVSDINVKNIKQIYWSGIGDIDGVYAQESQLGRVNTGNEIGHIYGENIVVGDAIYAVLFKGEGTSKFEFYEGTNQLFQRQGLMGLKVKSHTIYCASGKEVIRVRGIRGQVDLGECRLFGCPISLYVLSGSGKWSADVVDGDGTIRVQNQRGGTLLRTNINKGNDANSATSDLYASGYESKNCTVHLKGIISTTTSREAASAGATRIAINPFTSGWSAVSPNDLVQIKSGTNIIEARATSFAVEGALFLDVTPLTKPIASGATITIDNRVELDYLNMSSQSSEYGLYSENAIIKKLDFSDMGWSGRHTAKMYNTRANIIGRLPSSDARRLGTSSDQGIWADYKCRLVGMNLEIPAGSDGDEAIFLQSYSGSREGAVLTLIGGVVGNINTLSPNTNYPLNQIHFNGVVNNEGVLLKPLGRSGSNANGYWVKHDNGVVECWLRNVTVGATQPYVWTFPTPFANTASTFVTATSTNGITSRVGSAISISSTQANVWLVDNTATTSGTASTSLAGMNLYAKGFWKLPT